MNMFKKIGLLVTVFSSIGCFASTELHDAAKRGDLERVQALIVAGANVNAQNVFGYTPLHDAAWYGHLEVVQALIAAGASIHAQDNIGSTPLHLAAMHRHRGDIVQALILAGANVNAQDVDGETPLHDPALFGYLEVVQALIAARANIAAQTNSGKTPVQLAAQNGHTVIVDYINAYIQRVKEVHARDPMIRRTLAMATHPRLGAESPLNMLPQHLLHDIADLATEAELHDAAQPK